MSTVTSQITTGGIILILVLIFILVKTIIVPLVAKHFGIKTNFIIVGVYLCMLILLSFICLLMPRSALISVANPSKVTDNNDKIEFIDKRVSAGDFSTPSGYTITESSFVAQSSDITVLVENFGATIVNKTKGVDTPDNGDGKIDVYCYMSEHPTFNGLALPLQTQAPSIEYSENQISIKSVEQQKFVMYEFADGNSAQQFISGSNDLFSLYATRGEDAIVVVLPRGVSISGSSTITNN